MARHIIDTESPDFDGIPMRLRESLKGAVLLDEDRREDGSLRGVISIDMDNLTKRPDEKLSPENLSELPSQYHSRPYIEYIVDDAESEDKSGHRKYAPIYEELMDEARERFNACGISDTGIAALKIKLGNARELISG